MESSDEAIERVLAGLRDAKPPAGMDQRILQAVRDDAPAKRGWSLVMPWHMSGMGRAIAAAGVVLVSSLACWTALRNHKPVSNRQTISASPVKPEVQATAVRPQPPLHARPILRVTEKANVRRARSVSEMASSPLYDMGAGNHPAPEAPLTSQEKLLLRLAHKGDPVELAVLNPSLWAARDAEEKAEVKKFFEPSTTKDDK